LIKLKEKQQLKEINEATKIVLKFEILPGTMPEGYEMKVQVPAVVARSWIAEDTSCYCAFEFLTTLAQYASRKKGRVVLLMSSLLLLFITIFILLMRAESILYFKFNKYLYLYSIIAATFLLSRYLFGALYKPIEINAEFTPGVTIIIPCFNEEKWIERTINSCMNQDYPIDKLEVIVVDDCSNDNSVEAIKAAVEKLYKQAGRFKTEERLKYVVQEVNGGKREALARGALMAKHELVVFVDSDSFLDPYAIRNLVQPFQDPKMGGVSGRTDVANTYTNALTKMQSVRYYIAFRIMKSAEAYFDAVTCLSGPLSCYRKDLVLLNMKDWLNQKFLGQKATFGDDRSLTNFILKKYRTSYQDSAVCYTIVPNSYKTFLKQQMRWKRSWLRESIIAGSFIWKKEPFTSLFFYMGLIVPIAAPIVVLYNLIYVPVMHRVFPTTFLVGLLMMSLLMSFTQLFYRKSTTWLFGMLFCIYYEAVLLWQMPVAWVTFWKSTWGTRMTPEDLKEEKRKAEKRDEMLQKQAKKKR
jgi:hyaluronan synthase